MRSVRDVVLDLRNSLVTSPPRNNQRTGTSVQESGTNVSLLRTPSGRMDSSFKNSR